MKRKAFVPVLTIILILFGFAYARAGFHNTFINIFEKARDSVASITVKPNSSSPNAKPTDLKGSGFVWTSDGYIISAAHLFQGNIKEIEISIGQKVLRGRLVGKDNNTDIALVKVEAPMPLKTLQFGNSDDIKVGEWVAAIGDPFGLEDTMTHGIISGKKRNIGLVSDEFIQHDAAINPGNSG